MLSITKFSRFLTVLCLTFLFIFLLSFKNEPVLGQIPDLGAIEQNLSNNSQINYTRQGNLDIAPVKLDGKTVILIAELSPNDSQKGIVPVVLRVRRIENRLQDLVRYMIALSDKKPPQFNPNTFTVTVSTLNNQTILLASDSNQLQPRAIATVTELDAEANWEYSTVSELAQAQAEKIHQALLQAWEARQPEARLRHTQIGILILGVIIAISLLLMLVQKQLKRWWLKLKESEELDEEVTLETQPQLISDNKRLIQLSQIIMKRVFEIFRQQTQQEKIELNQSLRGLLWWLQIILWFMGFVFIFWQFPELEYVGTWLFKLPVKLLLVFFCTILLKGILYYCITFILQKWTDSYPPYTPEAERIKLRVPTIKTALKQLINWFVILSGIVLFAFWFNLVIFGGVAVVGLLAVFSQNFLKDYLSGATILFEDQFAIGDIIKIGNITGTVEYLSLRMTQIRNLDGELHTFANGSFNNVANLTNQWSRLNLGVDVAYNTDLDKAIAVIQKVALEMEADPNWNSIIVETPTVLGVDAFGDNSITIRLIIKTQPLRQWDVGREYRLRIKKAFDQAGISIPFPQRSIWFENPLPTK